MKIRQGLAALMVVSAASAIPEAAQAGYGGPIAYRYSGTIAVEVTDLMLLGGTPDGFFGISTPGTYFGSYTFDVDPTGATLIPAGQDPGSVHPFSTDLYGVSETHISNFQFAFGNVAWSEQNLIDPGVFSQPAKIWIATGFEDPTAIQFMIGGGTGFAEIGGWSCDQNSCTLVNFGTLFDFAAHADTRLAFFSVSTVQVAESVPEPGSLVLVSLGLAGLASMRRRMR